MDYFKRVELLSSSEIKKLIKKGEDSKQEYRSQFTLGTIVDEELTEGKSRDELRIIDRGVIVPKPQMKLFVDHLYKLYRSDLMLSDDIPSIREAYLHEAYDVANSKIKTFEQMTKEFFESDCQGYWNHLINREKQAKDGQPFLILDYEEEQVDRCVSQMRNSRFIEYFDNSDTVFTQLEIYTKYFKIKLDSLKFDVDTLKLQPIDLKTIGSYAENALYNILAFRYDIQAYYYSFVLQTILNGEEFTSNNPKFDELMRFRKAITLSDTFDFVFVSKNFTTQVLEVKYLIEDEKEILGKTLYTRHDVEKAIEIHRYCRDLDCECNLTNYYLSMGSSITI